MANEKRLIDANALSKCIKEGSGTELQKFFADVCVATAPTVDAVPVVHGRWNTEPGDLHRIGYAIWCSECNRVHFVHYPFTLGSLCGCKELFEKPKFCPNCGAKMDGDGNG